MQLEGPVEPGGVGVDQQLRRVEAMPLLRRPGAVGAQAVAGADTDAADRAVENVKAPRRQQDALELGLARLIEEAKLNRGRVGREDGDVDAVFRHRHAERLGTAGGQEMLRHARSASTRPASGLPPASSR
jgi:Zn-dependent alcohol dehydrogenase